MSSMSGGACGFFVFFFRLALCGSAEVDVRRSLSPFFLSVGGVVDVHEVLRCFLFGESSSSVLFVGSSGSLLVHASAGEGNLSGEGVDAVWVGEHGSGAGCWSFMSSRMFHSSDMVSCAVSVSDWETRHSSQAESASGSFSCVDSACTSM